MNTIKDKEFDYQAYVKKNSPASEQIRRGPEARQQRFEAARTRFTIRIDEDILEQFKQLAQQEQGYEQLINQALREWLSARDVKELVRGELQQIVRQALSSSHLGT